MRGRWRRCRMWCSRSAPPTPWSCQDSGDRGQRRSGYPETRNLGSFCPTLQTEKTFELFRNCTWPMHCTYISYSICREYIFRFKYKILVSPVSWKVFCYPSFLFNELQVEKIKKSLKRMVDIYRWVVRCPENLLVHFLVPEHHSTCQTSTDNQGDQNCQLWPCWDYQTPSNKVSQTYFSLNFSLPVKYFF